MVIHFGGHWSSLGRDGGAAGINDLTSACDAWFCLCACRKNTIGVPKGGGTDRLAAPQQRMSTRRLNTEREVTVADLLHSLLYCASSLLAFLLVYGLTTGILSFLWAFASDHEDMFEEGSGIAVAISSFVVFIPVPFLVFQRFGYEPRFIDLDPSTVIQVQLGLFSWFLVFGGAMLVLRRITESVAIEPPEDSVLGRIGIFVVIAMASYGSYYGSTKVEADAKPLLWLYRESPETTLEAPESKAKELASEIHRIREALSDYESLSIGKLKNELEKALYTMERLQEEADAKEQLVAKLVQEYEDNREQAEQEALRADEQAKRAAEIERLAEEKLDIVAARLTAGSSREGRKYFLLGAALSLAVAFLPRAIRHFRKGKHDEEDEKRRERKERLKQGISSAS